MAEGIISFPFRLSPTGEVAVTGHGTDAEVDEAIAVVVLTMVGERPMNEGFGIPDPAFAGLTVGDVQVNLDEYGPPGVRVTDVIITPQSDSQSTAAIDWSHEEESLSE